MTIDDKRTDAEKAAPIIGFVVMLDQFMSGWGEAPGRSMFALMVRDCDELERVVRHAKSRGEMKRVHFTPELPSLRRGDHLAVRGPTAARAWY